MKVWISPEAQRQFRDLPALIRRRVLVITDRLEQWPNVSGVKPLRGSLAGRFRIRTGDYRVQFSLSGETVVVEKIGHRDGFYED